MHENEGELVETARLALPEVVHGAPPAGELHLKLYAVVEAAVEVTTLESLRRLDGHHVLAWPAVERRFHYRRPGLHLIVLKVYHLSQPLVIPNLFQYDGCRSWVRLESELPVTAARPVLDEPSFRTRMAALQEALGLDPAAVSGHRSAGSPLQSFRPERRQEIQREEASQQLAPPARVAHRSLDASPGLGEQRDQQPDVLRDEQVEFTPQMTDESGARPAA